MSVWIFQAVPKNWDLTKEIPARLNTIDNWQANQHRDKMKTHEKVYLWQAGKHSGIYGIGHLVGKLYHKLGKWRYHFKYDKQLNPPILKGRLLRHPVLKNLQIIRTPRGTNFLLTQEEHEALEVMELISEQDNLSIQSQFMEGSAKQVSVTVYERNPKARRECLEHYGYDCCICGFNFENVYGEQGAGFIHVHHLKQMAKRKKPYKVNPISELRPICPNCHAMIHKGSNMFSIDELKNLLKK
jgi:hypothetical protein